MTDIFELPELLLNVLSFVKSDPQSFTRCLRVDKRWREIVIENAQQLLEDDIYERCQGATVSVKCLSGEPFEFLVPGYQAQLLAISGAIVGKDDLKLWFTSRETAEYWWASARRYVAAASHDRPSPLTPIDWEGNDRSTAFSGGKLMAPVVRPKTGQLWFWVWDTRKNTTLEEIKAELLKAMKSTEPHVIVSGSGLGLVGFDGRDRIWFKTGASHILHGLSETEYVTLLAKSRTEAGIPERDSRYKEYFHSGEINALKEPIAVLDQQNRFYISDSVGVHIIHPDEPQHFDYFSTYKINYERGIFYEKSETFTTLFKYVDTTGKLFVWSTPGIGGWSGTVGYWTFDGTKWENVDAVQGIYDLAVRVLEKTRQIWLFKAREVQILEEPLSGASKPVLVPLKELTGLDSAWENRILARSQDRHESIAYFGSKAVLLDSKNHQREPPVLPDKVTAQFKVVDLPRSGWGNNTVKDGVIYFANEKSIVAASVDGKKVTNFACTGTLPDPRIHFVLTKPRKYGKPLQVIYLKAGNTSYILDPTVKFVDFSGVPAMHLATSVPPPPSPDGRMIFNMNNEAHQWHCDQLPQRLAFKLASDSQCDLIHGNGGLMISRSAMSCIHFNTTTVMLNNLEELADKHYDTLVKYLPFPPNRPYQYLIHDGLGNIWIDRSDHIAVRTPKGLIQLNTKKYLSPEGYFTVKSMTPLGDGSAIVLVGNYKSLLVKIDQKKQTLKAKPTDVQIGVKYTIYAAEWKENIFYDKRGTAHVLSEEWSDGMLFKTYYRDQDNTLKVLGGRLLLVDRHNGKWFYQHRIQSKSPAMVIYRPDNSTAEFTLEISLPKQTLCEDFLGEHSVWVFVDGGMTRIKFNGTALEITEELKVVVPSRVRTVAAKGRHVLWNAEYNWCRCMVLDEKSVK